MLLDLTTFKLVQFIESDTARRKGINNIPPPEVIDRLQELYKRILVPVAKLLEADILVTSGYRCKELNKAIGGAPKSQHVKGEAADFKVMKNGVYMPNEDIYQRIRASTIPYDQIIEEYNSWIHVSTASTPRRQALKAGKQGGKTIYIPDFSTPSYGLGKGL
jgi:hypothetical protein